MTLSRFYRLVLWGYGLSIAVPSLSMFFVSLGAHHDLERSMAVLTLFAWLFGILFFKWALILLAVGTIWFLLEDAEHLKRREREDHDRQRRQNRRQLN